MSRIVLMLFMDITAEGDLHFSHFVPEGGSVDAWQLGCAVFPVNFSVCLLQNRLNVF